MSPRARSSKAVQHDFPRVSGDEPKLFEMALTEYALSPRERG